MFDVEEAGNHGSLARVAAVVTASCGHRRFKLHFGKHQLQTGHYRVSLQAGHAGWIGPGGVGMIGVGGVGHTARAQARRRADLGDVESGCHAVLNNQTRKRGQ